MPGVERRQRCLVLVRSGQLGEEGVLVGHFDGPREVQRHPNVALEQLAVRIILRRVRVLDIQRGACQQIDLDAPRGGVEVGNLGFDLSGLQVGKQALGTRRRRLDLPPVTSRGLRGGRTRSLRDACVETRSAAASCASVRFDAVTTTQSSSTLPAHAWWHVNLQSAVRDEAPEPARQVPNACTERRA